MYTSRAQVVALLVSILVAGPALAVDADVVTFTTDDGAEIVADYYAPSAKAKAPVAILLHMYRSDRSAWKPLVAPLHQAGFAVLAIDMRGHGQSIKPETKNLPRRAKDRDEKLFNAMHKDVFAAYRFLAQKQECDMSRLAIVGASVGCSVAIDYAARDRSVDVVACMSPGENYLGVDSRAHMETFAKHGKRPVLLLAAPAERKACDTLHEINPTATVRILGKGKVHGTNMFSKVKGIEQEVVDFLTKHVGAESTAPVIADVNGGVYWPIGSEQAAKIKPENRRTFSSGAEADERGYKAPK